MSDCFLLLFPVFLSIHIFAISSLAANRRLSDSFGAALGLPEKFHYKRQYSLHDVYLEWCQRKGIDPEAVLVVFLNSHAFRNSSFLLHSCFSIACGFFSSLFSRQRGGPYKKGIEFITGSIVDSFTSTLLMVIPCPYSRIFIW